MYNDLDPDDIATWQIIAIVFVIFVLTSVAAYALYNIVKSVA